MSAILISCFLFLPLSVHLEIIGGLSSSMKGGGFERPTVKLASSKVQKVDELLFIQMKIQDIQFLDYSILFSSINKN